MLLTEFCPLESGYEDGWGDTDACNASESMYDDHREGRASACADISGTDRDVPPAGNDKRKGDAQAGGRPKHRPNRPQFMEVGGDLHERAADIPSIGIADDSSLPIPPVRALPLPPAIASIVGKMSVVTASSALVLASSATPGQQTWNGVRALPSYDA